MAIQEYCLKIIYYYRIKIPIIESSDIELLYYIKDIDLHIGRSMITIRKKGTSKIIKLFLNLKTIGAWLFGDRVVDFNFYWSHGKSCIILSYAVTKFSWEIIISSQVVL